MDLNQITQDMLNVIDSYGFKQEGAYNLRYNGSALCHGDSENIKIVKNWAPQIVKFPIIVSASKTLQPVTLTSALTTVNRSTKPYEYLNISIKTKGIA